MSRVRLRTKTREFGEQNLGQKFFFPPTPDDPRLKPLSAVIDDNGRLRDAAYKDFIETFASEFPTACHPHPFSPGLGFDEVCPRGLKVWNDDYAGKSRLGAGWIAVNVVSKAEDGKPEEKWFNVRAWGSWRLAFLLARLQRRVWECKAELLPWDHDGEDKLVVIDGARLNPETLRSAAHEVARAIRSRQGTMQDDIGLAGILRSIENLPTRLPPTIEKVMLEPDPVKPIPLASTVLSTAACDEIEQTTGDSPKVKSKRLCASPKVGRVTKPRTS